MAENQIPNQQNSSDEIDLGQLFQMIGRGFNAIVPVFLKGISLLEKKRYNPSAFNSGRYRNRIWPKQDHFQKTED